VSEMLTFERTRESSHDLTVNYVYLLELFIRYLLRASS